MRAVLVINRSNVFYLLLAGTVIFFGTFIGVRAGLAFKSSDGTELSPETLSNQTTMKIGREVPDLPLLSLDGSQSTLATITNGRRSLVGFLTLGCGACKDLLNDWSSLALSPEEGRQIVIVAVGTPEQAATELPQSVRDRYPIYCCEEVTLDAACGVSVFPTQAGIDQKGLIRFVASGYTKQIGRSFFDKYL
jgi:hypothetical protein